ncbi:MAG: T9SS type A sorting domain-containing protein, partial [Bacteroidetes bacterium]|nr:T9SS type A sorting domain-containing protein [Bacteroidota bacterium]
GLTGITNNTGAPDAFSLYQNYPNPFNPSTKISFDIPGDAYVSLKVFDILGREAASLIDGKMSRGYHEVSFDASGLAGGVYFYKLSAGNYSGVKRMVLSK